MTKLRFSGKKLRYARRELELSHQKLGTAIGRSRITIYNWEKEKSQPLADDLLALSKALKKPIGYFYAES